MILDYGFEFCIHKSIKTFQIHLQGTTINYLYSKYPIIQFLISNRNTISHLILMLVKMLLQFVGCAIQKAITNKTIMVHIKQAEGTFENFTSKYQNTNKCQLHWLFFRLLHTVVYPQKYLTAK